MKAAPAASWNSPEPTDKFASTSKEMRGPVSVETNKQLVRRLHHLWSTGDIGAIDGVYSPEFVAHFPISVDWPERRGLEGVRRSMRRIRNAFPDWQEEVKDLIAEGDRVVSRYTSSGTHRGDFWGINATGRRVLVDEISIFRIVDGRVAEQWCSVDELGRLQQLGVNALPSRG